MEHNKYASMVRMALITLVTAWQRKHKSIRRPTITGDNIADWWSLLLNVVYRNGDSLLPEDKQQEYNRLMSASDDENAMKQIANRVTMAMTDPNSFANFVEKMHGSIIAMYKHDKGARDVSKDTRIYDVGSRSYSKGEIVWFTTPEVFQMVKMHLESKLHRKPSNSEVVSKLGERGQLCTYMLYDPEDNRNGRTGRFILCPSRIDGYKFDIPASIAKTINDAVGENVASVVDPKTATYTRKVTNERGVVSYPTRVLGKSTQGMSGCVEITSDFFIKKSTPHGIVDAEPREIVSELITRNSDLFVLVQMSKGGVASSDISADTGDADDDAVANNRAEGNIATSHQRLGEQMDNSLLNKTLSAVVDKHNGLPKRIAILNTLAKEVGFQSRAEHSKSLDDGWCVSKFEPPQIQSGDDDLDKIAKMVTSVSNYLVGTAVTASGNTIMSDAIAPKLYRALYGKANKVSFATNKMPKTTKDRISLEGYTNTMKAVIDSVIANNELNRSLAGLLKDGKTAFNDLRNYVESAYAAMSMFSLKPYGAVDIGQAEREQSAMNTAKSFDQVMIDPAKFSKYTGMTCGYSKPTPLGEVLNFVSLMAEEDDEDSPFGNADSDILHKNPIINKVLVALNHVMTNKGTDSDGKVLKEFVDNTKYTPEQPKPEPETKVEEPKPEQPKETPQPQSKPEEPQPEPEPDDDDDDGPLMM